MAAQWDKLDKTVTPAIDTITTYVGSPLWDALLTHMEERYKAAPAIEYSGCGMAPGWNVKFKKGGRSLCALYPEQGTFTALVVIGQREKAETELTLPSLTPYLQQLYAATKEGMGQRWLMIRVADAAVLEDVKRCVAIRRGPQKR